MQLVEKLTGLAAQFGKSVAELAIAWTLRRDDVTSAIVGARSPQQIEGTVAAADWTLDDECVATIDGWLNERIAGLEKVGALDTGRV